MNDPREQKEALHDLIQKFDLMNMPRRTAFIKSMWVKLVDNPGKDVLTADEKQTIVNVLRIAIANSKKTTDRSFFIKFIDLFE